METQSMMLRVSKVVRETFDTITIYFDDPEQRVQYRPGQFLTLTARVGGKIISRPYSLCTSPYLDTQPAVTVKRVLNGMMSNYLVDTVQPGQELEISGPTGLFTTELNPTNQRHLILFGGGSGITPLLSLARSVLHVELGSKVTLVYASRSVDAIIFKDLLLTMQQVFKNRFIVVHVLEFLEEFPLRNMIKGLHFIPGRLNGELTGSLMYHLADCHSEGNEYFVCGPEGMMDVVTSSLRGLGVLEPEIHLERFTAPITETLSVTSEEFAQTVEIVYKGRTYKILVPAHQTILTAATQQGLALPHSCQGALCGTCRAIRRSGQVKLDQNYALTDEELAQGYVLTCVGRPLTPHVVLEIE